MESLLSGGYSSVYTRLGFDTKMFTLKSAEYVKHKHDIIEQLRNLYGEKMKKKKNWKEKGWTSYSTICLYKKTLIVEIKPFIGYV